MATETTVVVRCDLCGKPMKNERGHNYRPRGRFRIGDRQINVRMRFTEYISGYDDEGYTEERDICLECLSVLHLEYSWEYR